MIIRTQVQDGDKRHCFIAKLFDTDTGFQYVLHAQENYVQLEIFSHTNEPARYKHSEAVSAWSQLKNLDMSIVDFIEQTLLNVKLES